MTYRRWLLAAGLGLAACGGDDSSSGQLQVCGGGGDTVFVAYRDGAKPWVQLPDSKLHKIDVADDFEIVRVFKLSSTGGYFSVLSRGTRGEIATSNGQPASCAQDGQPVTVTGELAQTGDVWIDNTGISQGAGTFMMDVTAGVHDVVATTGNTVAGGKILLRRDQQFSGPTTLPKLDIDADGVALMPTTYNVTGASTSEPLSTEVALYTGSQTDVAFVSSRDTAIADVVPASVLRDSDQQWVFLSGANHGADLQLPGAPTSFELLPPLTNIGFDSMTHDAHWVDLPNYSSLSLGVIESASQGTRYQFVSATAGWMDKHPANKLAFDSEIPGFDPAWTLGPTMPATASLSLYVDKGDNLSLWSSADSTGPAPRTTGGSADSRFEILHRLAAVHGHALQVR